MRGRFFTMAGVYSPIQLHDYVRATNLKGKKYSFLSDLTRDEMTALFKVAEMMEPYTRTGLELMRDKVLCALFFEPSTRTRFSTETAMHRLGGRVITESNPLQTTSAAKDESMWDMLRVMSQYADILVLRHPNEEKVFEALPAATIPVISGGYGSITHPTQGLLDVYTLWRIHGTLEGKKILVSCPDLSRARSGHSCALGAAIMGAEIIYAGPKDLPVPQEQLAKLRATGAKITEVFDPSAKEHDELIIDSDAVYLPGCRIPKGGDARELYMEYAKSYYIGLEPLVRAKKEKGKTVGIMHSLPRFAGEFDFEIDNTDNELYFKQVAYGIPIRMSLITSMIGLD